MELHHIESKNCPDCGAVAEVERQQRQHCNGSHNEERTFSCGATLRFSPNFMKLHGCTPCPNTKEETDNRARKNKAKGEVLEAITNLSCDDKYKAALAYAIKYVN